jgi:protein O-GlcNAc transferase
MVRAGVMTQPIEQILGHAVQLHQSGRLPEAESRYRMVLVQIPNQVDALHLLGVLLSQTGRASEALPLLRQAAALEPNSADILSNLGIALSQSGEDGQAIESYRAALQLRPDHRDARMNLVAALEQAGEQLRQKGQLADALQMVQQALELAPGRAETHNFLGVARASLGQTQAAIEAFGKSIALNPDYADPHNNLGLCFQSRGRTQDAIEQFKAAIKIRPNFPGAFNNLGNLLKESDDLDLAIEAYREALRLKPDLVQSHDNLLLTLQAHPDFDASSIYREHQEWNRLHAAPLAAEIRPHQNDRDADRRLKIGYVSPDFREHSVAHFLIGLLPNHDPREVEIYCYADVAREDGMTQKLRAAAHHWRSLVGETDAAAAEMIRQDGIDILVDLAGHTGENRLLAFARKPAPVQVTYCGYPGTTGLTTIDWRLTDALADPLGAADPFYSEKLFRLPKTFLCFTPPQTEPSPPTARRPVTFGSFNYLPKINLAVVATWSEILRAVPGSKLLLKSHGLSDDFSRQRMLDRFAAQGIEADRLVLHGKIPSLTDHLRLYDQVDIALDPFPYNGTTTTCEALWMGVPVLTLAGGTHAGRVGVSLLSNVGLPQLIARDRNQYVQIAKQLAGDADQLTQLRSGIRKRVAESSLVDAKSFAKDVEAAYRQMWRQWCGGGATK